MNYDLMFTIKEHGKHLCSINLLIVGQDQSVDVFKKPMIDFIIEGCPKLKTLTFESLRGWKHWKEVFASFPEIPEDVYTKPAITEKIDTMWDLTINKKSLKALYNGCKELKVLKLTKVRFEGIFTENEIKKILPDCNVEIKECQFKDLDDISLYTEDSSDSDSDQECQFKDLDDISLYTEDSSDSDNSFGDGEQDSNAGRADESDEDDDIPPLEAC